MKSEFFYTLIAYFAMLAVISFSPVERWFLVTAAVLGLIGILLGTVVASASSSEASR